MYLKFVCCLAFALASLFQVVQLDDSLTCSKNGMVCSSDCQRVVVCAYGQALTLQQCPKGHNCSPEDLRCHEGLTDCNEKPIDEKTLPSFRCFETGEFPNPVNDSATYICGTENLGSTASMVCSCPEGFKVDLDNQLTCSKNATREAIDCDEQVTGKLGNSPYSYYCSSDPPGIHVFLDADRKMRTATMDRNDSNVRKKCEAAPTPEITTAPTPASVPAVTTTSESKLFWQDPTPFRPVTFDLWI